MSLCHTGPPFSSSARAGKLWVGAYYSSHPCFGQIRLDYPGERECSGAKGTAGEISWFLFKGIREVTGERGVGQHLCQLCVGVVQQGLGQSRTSRRQQFFSGSVHLYLPWRL